MSDIVRWERMLRYTISLLSRLISLDFLIETDSSDQLIKEFNDIIGNAPEDAR